MYKSKSVCPNILNVKRPNIYTHTHINKYTNLNKLIIKNWSILMSSEDTTLLFYPVISSCGVPYLEPLSLQTRTKLRKSLKGILNYWKLQIMFKSQSKLAKAFILKIVYLKNLHLVSFVWTPKWILIWRMCKTPKCKNWRAYRNLIVD